MQPVKNDGKALVIIWALLAVTISFLAEARGNQAPKSIQASKGANVQPSAPPANPVVGVDNTSAPIQQTERITRANWRQHPKIEAVRAIVRSVNEAWAKREFKTSQRRFESCTDVFTEFRRISVDSKGVVRRYEFAYSAEDDSRTDQYYYDESGQLRFVLISGWNASAGSEAEHRIYFDESGRRLWEDAKGHGLYWPAKWPDKQLHKTDAAKDFANNSRCGRKIKPKERARSTLPKLKNQNGGLSS